MTTIDSKKLWESALVEIELSVSKPNFTTWFKNTSISRIDDGVVYVNVPNPFVKDWLSDKYHKFILKILRNLYEGVRVVEYIITKDENSKSKDSDYGKMNILRGHYPNVELPLHDYYINKEDNLNPRYTFDSFVVGPFNELAHAASQAVIKKPGALYNPLFIYGGTGHGKTHLTQAVGNFIKKSFPEKKVFYVTSEKFCSDYINSLQSQKIAQFKEKYRKYDVLIMDDIQFLSKTEKTQEELFHLFNVLYENNKQIIFSSDRHPNFIPNLEDRLKSRFAAGMIVDIPQPDHESRILIIKSKLNANNFNLSDEIISFVATAIESNVRELEGILNSLICQTQLKNKELTLLEVKNLIKNSAKPKKNVSVKDIIKVIASFYNIEEESIYEKTRRKEVVKPRQLTMYILREDFSISYPSIGQKMGGRDHTTVIHSCEKVKNDLKNDPVLSQELSQIRALL